MDNIVVHIHAKYRKDGLKKGRRKTDRRTDEGRLDKVYAPLAMSAAGLKLGVCPRG